METFVEHVARLMRGRGLTQSQLVIEAADYGSKGTAMDTIRNAVTGRRGGGWPSTIAIEAIARALGVDPMEFAVYRIQLARQRLDPAVAGMRSALEAADLLLSAPIPEEIAEAAARQREVPPPGGASSSASHPGKGRAA